MGRVALRVRVRNGILSVVVLIALQSFPVSPAFAHAFGIRYDLPLPLWLYLTGAGAAVALSFAIMAFFMKETATPAESYQFNLLSLPVLRWLGHPTILNVIRALSVGVFFLVLATGFFGNRDPFENLSPTLVWVGWWVGMAFISSIFGNLWDLLNPWTNCYRAAQAFSREEKKYHTYPAILGQWPAMIFLFIFVWMELISEQAEQPRNLAALISFYSVITWAGMSFFGLRVWRQNAEVFSVLFALFARFAPFHGDQGRLMLRPPAIGLLCRQPVSLSAVCFVLLLLTSVTFDGILETPSWAAILVWISESRLLRSTLIFLQDNGVDLIVFIKTIALFIFPLLFILTFSIAGAAIAWAGGGDVPTRDVIGYFVLSIVPIAIAYHLSHYLSYLLIAGQNLIPLVSDPFGFGWDLFGTRNYAVDIGVINAKMVWFVSVTAIVVGHVAAVYIAHVMALRVFETRRQALSSQIPMLVLMVGYTMISLWILSQPIIS